MRKLLASDLYFIEITLDFVEGVSKRYLIVPLSEASNVWRIVCIFFLWLSRPSLVHCHINTNKWLNFFFHCLLQAYNLVYKIMKRWDYFSFFVCLCFALSTLYVDIFFGCKSLRICSRWWCLDPTWMKPVSSQEAMEDRLGASFQQAPSKV